MSDGTKIEWTDATVNAVNGCSVISQGCTNCYAMRLAGTRLKHTESRAGLTIDTKAGPVWNGTIKINYDAMMQPLSWRRPRHLFWNAHGDLFHVAVPVETIAQVFGVAIAAYHLHGHISQLLTKRADRQRDLLNRPEFWDEVNANASMHVMDRVDPLDRRSDDARATLEDYDPDSPPPGLWLGTSTEDQPRADERVPPLLETPAAVRFVSGEPLLGAIDLEPWLNWGDCSTEMADGHTFGCIGCDAYCPNCPEHKAIYSTEEGPLDRRGCPKWITHNRVTLDWVIVGGESGPGARPMNPAWVESLHDQCAAARVPFFFKQWGEFLPDRIERSDPRSLQYPPGHVIYRRVGKKAAGRKLHGVEHSAMPAPT